MTTKKNLQEQVRVLQKELSSFKAEQKKQREKPLYVVYPEHDYCERWYEENRKDIQAFHEDENNFIYWKKMHENDHMGHNGWKELATPHGNRKWSHHWGRFYMHGKLEEDACYDICDFNLQFPFDEALPTYIFQEKQFIEGLGILYKIKAKLANGKDILIFAHASLRCTLRQYLEDVTSTPSGFNSFAQQFGYLKPQGERTEYHERVWRLRNWNENFSSKFGFEPIYPIIPHDWGSWKEWLKKYKLSKVNGTWNGSIYRLDKVGEPDTFDTSFKWEGRIIYPDDEEALKHCMNPVEWS
tara:strand:+ start:115 stop:1008 length:894 start_codon:yes stop_codon:yes gene_type:complete